MKKMFAILLALVLVLGIVGCVTSNDPVVTDPPVDPPIVTDPPVVDVDPIDVTLKVWAPANQVETGLVDQLNDMFAAEHPEWNITFTVEIQGEDTAKDEVLKDPSVAGDVFMFANDQIEALIEAGAIARLGGKYADEVFASMPEAVYKTAMVGDALYAIPFTHNLFFMFYDKTLLSADDIGSLNAIVAKETADGVYNFHFDAAGGWKGGAYFYGAGNMIYGPDSVTYELGCDWNNATGLAVANFLIETINNPKVVYGGDGNVDELFADHKLGACFDGAWNYGSYLEKLGDDLGLAALPTFTTEAGTHQLKGFYGSKVIGVNSQADFPEVAVAYAAFIGGEAAQTLRFEMSNQIPTNTAAGASDAVQADPVAAVTVAAAAKSVTGQPTNSNFGSRYWANAGAFFDGIRSGDINKDNVQEKLDAFAAALAVE